MYWHPYYTFTSGSIVPPTPPSAGIAGGGGGTSSWERTREWHDYTRERQRAYDELYKKYLALERAKEREAAKVLQDELAIQQLSFEPITDVPKVSKKVAIEPSSYTEQYAEITAERIAAKKAKLERKLARDKRRLQVLTRRITEILVELAEFERKMKMIRTVAMIAFSLEPRIQ